MHRGAERCPARRQGQHALQRFNRSLRAGNGRCDRHRDGYGNGQDRRRPAYGRKGADAAAETYGGAVGFPDKTGHRDLRSRLCRGLYPDRRPDGYAVLMGASGYQRGQQPCGGHRAGRGGDSGGHAGSRYDRAVDRCDRYGEASGFDPQTDSGRDPRLHPDHLHGQDRDPDAE